MELQSCLQSPLHPCHGYTLYTHAGSERSGTLTGLTRNGGGTAAKIHQTFQLDSKRMAKSGLFLIVRICFIRILKVTYVCLYIHHCISLKINRDLMLCPLWLHTKALLCAWVISEAWISLYLLYGHCQFNELPPCSPPLSHTPLNICHWSASKDK